MISKEKFREIDSFHLTSFFGLDFLIYAFQNKPKEEVNFLRLSQLRKTW